jgi:hypothetical protein
MYASTWGMAERMRRDDKEPVASFGEFVYDYGDLGIQHGILWGIFETQNRGNGFDFRRAGKRKKINF